MRLFVCVWAGVAHAVLIHNCASVSFLLLGLNLPHADCLHYRNHSANPEMGRFKFASAYCCFHWVLKQYLIDPMNSAGVFVST